MRYISLFSGIEAASVAWEPLGWEPLAFCEIDEFPSAVLAHRFPDVENLGDITKVDWKEVIARHGRPDVVVGGSPCQAFSVAGKREGLMDARGQLMLEYVRAVAEIEPRWFVWENVPGVLSQDRGRAFGTLLREMDELGYGMAWRVLDAQFFGVAQRRRRVFLVGRLGEGGSAAAVLFEPESVSGNTQTSKQKREALARAAGRGAARGGGERMTLHQNASGDVHVAENQCGTLMASASVSRQQILIDGESSVMQATAIQTGNTGANGSGVTEECANALACSQPEAVAFAQNTRDEVRLMGGDGQVADTVPAQTWGTHKNETLLAECLTPWDVQSKRVFAEKSCGPTLGSGTNEGMNIQPVVMAHSKETSGGQVVYSIPSAAIGAPNSGTNARMAVEGMAPTLKADGKTHAVVEPVVMASAHTNAEIGEGGVAPSLMAHAEKQPPILAMATTCFQRSAQPMGASSSSTTRACEGDGSCSTRDGSGPSDVTVIDRAAFNQGGAALYAPHIERTDVMDTLVARGPHAVMWWGRYARGTSRG